MRDDPTEHTPGHEGERPDDATGYGPPEEEELDPEEAEWRIARFVASADELPDPSVEELAESVAALTRTALREVEALMEGEAHNKVLATQLLLGQRAHVRDGRPGAVAAPRGLHALERADHPWRRQMRETQDSVCLLPSPTPRGRSPLVKRSRPRSGMHGSERPDPGPPRPGRGGAGSWALAASRHERRPARHRRREREMSKKASSARLPDASES